jgi:hypothetical protein
MRESAPVSEPMEGSTGFTNLHPPFTGPSTVLMRCENTASAKCCATHWRKSYQDEYPLRDIMPTAKTLGETS